MKPIKCHHCECGVRRIVVEDRAFYICDGCRSVWYSSLSGLPAERHQHTPNVMYQHEYSYDKNSWFPWDIEYPSIERLTPWVKGDGQPHITVHHRIVKITREVVEGPND